ncbi:hypothetical protein NQ317_007713 [Molorchus minor]|uniref:Uncharacterized protein n=1 Tax=Molorchus minor TaxID=1323400 RepID=A0ABQ9IYK9_9CUCU|nr:hypothetical protein NQ317_007713 [Molorchus minor]
MTPQIKLIIVKQMKLNNPDVIKQKAVEIHTAIVKVNNSNLHLNTKKGEGQLSCTETETDYKKEKHKKKKMDRNKQVIDNSGVIGGEKIEGLVKSEWTKRKRETQKEKEEKNLKMILFWENYLQKKVFLVLKHDSIINSGYKVTSLKVHTEAKMRTEKSLEALKKSRLDNWRW